MFFFHKIEVCDLLTNKESLWITRKLNYLNQKQVWSEEDERLFDSVVWHLRNSVNNVDIEHSAGQLEDWLKSLKQRYTWKPNEEQMEALKTSFLYWKGTTKEVPHTERLESLYEQLKQL